MELPKLDAAIRIRSGKGPARRLRQQGLVPAVLYGHGIDTTSLSIKPDEITKALSGPMHTNTVLTLNIAGANDPGKGTFTAMVRDHQYDPVTRRLLHVDFLAVDLERPVRVEVPLLLTGRAVGVQQGGSLSVVFRALPVECLPADIPATLTADITELTLNANLTVGELEVPGNVTVLLENDVTVASVVAKRVEEEEKPEEEAAEGEEGEAEGEAREGDKAEDKKDADKGKDEKSEGKSS